MLAQRIQGFGNVNPPPLEEENASAEAQEADGSHKDPGRPASSDPLVGPVFVGGCCEQIEPPRFLSERPYIPAGELCLKGIGLEINSVGANSSC